MKSDNNEQINRMQKAYKRSLKNEGMNEKSPALDTLRLIFSLALLVLSITVIIFVYTFIKKNFKRGVDSDTLNLSQIDETQVQEIILDRAPEPGFYKDADDNIRYILQNSEKQYYELDQIINMENVSFLRNAWIVRDEKVYFIDNNGLVVTGDYSEKAMRYEFDKNGALSNIRYNTNYVPESTDTDLEYPGLVRGKMIWAFVDRFNSIDGFYSIMYKETTDSLSKYLGSATYKQYSLPFGMSIDGKNIYYLAYVSEPTDEQASINGKVFRMKVGDTSRYLMAENAEGYRVISDEDHTYIVYSSNGHVYLSEGPLTSDDMPVFDENGTYIVSIEEDKAYLSTLDGIHVTVPDGKFNVAGFSYELMEDGEIISVADSEGAVRGNYIYSSELGEFFGSRMSRIMRTNDLGVKEIISGEFPGSVSNFHYDSKDDYVYAEYLDTNGSTRIVKISANGNVDYLAESANTLREHLVSLEDGEVCVSYSQNGKTTYKKISKLNTVPLTAAIEPIVEYESGAPTQISIESYDEVVAEGPGYQVIDKYLPSNNVNMDSVNTTSAVTGYENSDSNPNNSTNENADSSLSTINDNNTQNAGNTNPVAPVSVNDVSYNAPGQESYDLNSPGNVSNADSGVGIAPGGY